MFGCRTRVVLVPFDSGISIELRVYLGTLALPISGVSEFNAERARSKQHTSFRRFAPRRRCLTVSSAHINKRSPPPPDMTTRGRKKKTRRFRKYETAWGASPADFRTQYRPGRDASALTASVETFFSPHPPLHPPWNDNMADPPDVQWTSCDEILARFPTKS